MSPAADRSILRFVFHPVTVAVFSLTTIIVGVLAIYEGRSSTPAGTNTTLEQLIKQQADLANKVKELENENKALADGIKALGGLPERIQELEDENSAQKREISALEGRICAVDRRAGKKCP